MSQPTTNVIAHIQKRNMHMGWSDNLDFDSVVIIKKHESKKVNPNLNVDGETICCC